MLNQRQVICILLLSLTILFGLSTRKFADLFPAAIVLHAGDMLYTIAVYFAAAIVFSSWKPLRLSLVSIGFSFLVEISQLSDFSWLVQIRQYPIGRLFLGNGFLWADLLRYLIGGCLVSMCDFLAQRWNSRTGSKKQSSG